MKSRILILIAILGISINSCKKGEEDPFISLRTRDARITAEWKLVSIDENYEHNFTTLGSPVTVIVTTVFDGTEMTVSTTINDETTTETYSFSQNLEIFNDGSYTLKTVENGNTTIKTNLWWWKNTDDNKEGIILEGVGEFDIERLAGDELFLYTEETTTVTTDGVENKVTSYKNLKFDKL
jgi:hypothetical protein